MKYQYVLILLIHLCFYTRYAQTTAIPDQSFEQALIDLGIDSDGTVNGVVATTDIHQVTALVVNFQEISDLTGIEDFSLLEHLDVSYNLLTSIDLTENNALKVLNLEENEFTSLDISQNTSLEELYIGNQEEELSPFNSIPTIDTANNTELRVLNCYFLYGLTSLDLSANSKLETLEVSFCDLENLDLSSNVNLETIRTGFLFSQAPDVISNDLSEIDLSNNLNLVSAVLSNSGLRSINAKNGNNTNLSLNAVANENLECILVDDENAATAGQAPYDTWSIPDAVTFSETECVLSLDDNEIVGLSLYPNPTSDVVAISNASSTAVSQITIMDITGKTVLKNENQTSISLQAVAAGVYFVQVDLENGAVGVSRVVKE